MSQRGQVADSTAFGRAYQAVDRFGFPAVIAAVLLWFLLAHVVPSSEDLAQSVRQQSIALSDLSTAIAVQTRTYTTLEASVRQSVDVTNESNMRLRQMMGDAPYPRRP